MNIINIKMNNIHFVVNKCDFLLDIIKLIGDLFWKE